jgi:hypothetical protein
MRYHVTAPATPGAQPTVIETCATLRDARRAARDHSRGERWLRGHDVRIERPDGMLVEYAGLGA